MAVKFVGIVVIAIQIFIKDLEITTNRIEGVNSNEMCKINLSKFSILALKSPTFIFLVNFKRSSILLTFEFFCNFQFSPLAKMIHQSSPNQEATRTQLSTWQIWRILIQLNKYSLPVLLLHFYFFFFYQYSLFNE